MASASAVSSFVGMRAYAFFISMVENPHRELIRYTRADKMQIKNVVGVLHIVLAWTQDRSYGVKPMMTNKSLLTEIERFCEANSMSPSGFGRWAVGNPNLVFDLEDCAYEIKLKTVNKIVEKMKFYKPKREKKNGK
jgi:hypothetical protein